MKKGKKDRDDRHEWEVIVERQMEINRPYKSNSINSPEWQELEAEEKSEDRRFISVHK